MARNKLIDLSLLSLFHSKIVALIPTKLSQLENDKDFKSLDTNTTYVLVKESQNIILRGSDGTENVVKDDTGSTIVDGISEEMESIRDEMGKLSTRVSNFQANIDTLSSEQTALSDDFADHVADFSDQSFVVSGLTDSLSNLKSDFQTLQGNYNSFVQNANNAMATVNGKLDALNEEVGKVASYVAEEGTINDWQYKKWSDGLVEARARKSVTVGNTWTAVNGHYRAITTVELPFDFPYDKRIELNGTAFVSGAMIAVDGSNESVGTNKLEIHGYKEASGNATYTVNLPIKIAGYIN